VALPHALRWQEWSLRRRIIVGGAVIACLALLPLAGWGWWNLYQSRGLAELDLASLRARALGPNPSAAAQAEAIKGLESVIERYPWLTALPEAAYQLGNLHYQANAFDRARAAYELALAKGGRGTLATLCRIGIGYAWEAQGDHAKALAAFEAALQGRTAQDFLYEELLLNVARSHELLGQRDRARELYQRLLKELPNSGRAEDIRSRLARLGPSGQQ